MTQYIAAAIMFFGAFLCFVAGLGVLRMPDVLTRMQTSTKAGTLGMGCIVVALAVYFADMGVAIQAMLVVAFLFLTAPIAAHMIARAAYVSGATADAFTIIDDLKGRYDLDTHTLESVEPTTSADVPHNNDSKASRPDRDQDE